MIARTSQVEYRHEVGRIQHELRDLFMMLREWPRWWPDGELYERYVYLLRRLEAMIHELERHDY